MLFSILIPAYKSLFLQEAIRSCLLQTYDDYEIIVVNDGSPENLDDVVNAFSDKRIRYFKNEVNFGSINLVDNWNKCLAFACGKYVICMGDDDVLLPTCLEDYYKLISKYPDCKVFHTRTQIIDANSNVIAIQEARPEFESVYSLIWHRNHGRIQFIGDFLFEASSLKRRGGFYKVPMALSSDDISVCIAADVYGIANSNMFGFQYRMHNETVTNSGNIKLTAQGVSIAKKWYTSFLSIPAKSNDDELMRRMTIIDLDSYYQSMFMSLYTRDLVSEGRRAYLWWREHEKDFQLSASVLKRGYLHFLRSKINVI